ncbi:DEP domain-containing protein 1B-like isoform X2 [Liolophura sinensis]|uniref:DEP domain-containing protein 1B-like isoform X2 n=1 Tax=Liolophura sinensis TaxID=3198878 RepID=UPI0031584690
MGKMEAKTSDGMTGTTMGPYRATKLWNDIIRTFRTGLPLGRNRRYMKTYDNCFAASDAVDWLHEHLKCNPNFGETVTRAQTVQLMQKFHKSRVFEDVRGSKHNRGDFSDNGRLFRFTHNSPIKTMRAPLGSKTNLMGRRDLSQPLKLDHEKLSPITCIPPTGLPECRLVARPLSQEEIINTWKDYALESLQKTVGVENLDELLDSNLVNGQFIMHNCLFVNKNGVVTNIEPKDQLPHWTLSAMRCLAHWPNKIDSLLPQYPGFEKDVFRVVCEYFQGLREPLLTFDMYEVITNVFVFTENRFIKHSSPNTSEHILGTPSSISSFTSVENLMLNLTMNLAGPCYRRSAAPKGITRSASVQDYQSGSPSLSLRQMEPVAESSNIYGTKRYGSMTSLPIQPVTKFETAFGPDNRTVTRVFYSSNSSNSLDCGSSTLSRDFFSHGCLASDIDQQDTNPHKPVPISTSEDDLAFRSQSWSGDLPRGRTYQRPRRRKLSGPNGLIRCSESAHQLTTSGNQSHGLYNTLPEKRNSQNSLNRRESFNHAVLKTNSGMKLNHKNNDHETVHRLESQGIDNPSFSYDKNSENTLTNKPPPYKPPPSYHRNSSHSSTTDKAAKPPYPPRIHIQVERCGDSNPTSLFGPGYRRVPKITRRSNSFSNLTASPITSAPGLETPSFLKRSGSLPELSASNMKEKMQKCFQICLLLVPPANRRKLHLLLRMISKMLENKDLSLDESQPLRALLLDKFARSILRSPEEVDMDELLVLQIVGFLVDHYTEIMLVPKDLKSTVETQLTVMKQSSTQVSMAQFEKQRLSHSQQALSDLLEGIVTDTGMTQKEKKRRLKEFQKTYPSIYERRFPTRESVGEILPSSGRPKPPLLSRPLQKLKNMRL